MPAIELERVIIQRIERLGGHPALYGFRTHLTVDVLPHRVHQGFNPVCGWTLLPQVIPGKPPGHGFADSRVPVLLNFCTFLQVL